MDSPPLAASICQLHDHSLCCCLIENRRGQRIKRPRYYCFLHWRRYIDSILEQSTALLMMQGQFIRRRNLSITFEYLCSEKKNSRIKGHKKSISFCFCEMKIHPWICGAGVIWAVWRILNRKKILTGILGWFFVHYYRGYVIIRKVIN